VCNLSVDAKSNRSGKPRAKMKIALRYFSFLHCLAFALGKRVPLPIRRFFHLLAWRSASRRDQFGHEQSNETLKSLKGTVLLSSIPPIADLSAKRSSCSCKMQNNDLKRKD